MAVGDLVTDFDANHGADTQSCPLTDDRWFERPAPVVEASDDDDFDSEEDGESGDVEFGGSEADDFADFDEEDFDDDFDDDFEEEEDDFDYGEQSLEDDADNESSGNANDVEFEED